MYIEVNGKLNDFSLDIFKENDYEKYNIGTEMLCKTLGIKDFMNNKIRISNFENIEEVVELIKYFVFDSTYSIKSFNDKELTITYKPYMKSNDFIIVCYDEDFKRLFESLRTN